MEITGRPRYFKVAAFAAALVLSGLALHLCERLVAPRIGYSLICREIPSRADLILVLGGEFYGARVRKGAELGALGYAPLVLISGPPYAGRPEGEWAIDYLERFGYRRSLFCSFAHSGTSTIDEAVAVARELHRRRVKRVLLVTSAFHSRRADLVLRLFSSGIRFTSVPADDSYDPERWWDDPYSRRIFFSEWSKLLGSLVVALGEP